MWGARGPPDPCRGEALEEATRFLSELDPGWVSKSLKEFREGGEAVVFLEITVGEVSRQGYGSSPERGAAAYALALDDAIINIAAIFAATRPRSGRQGGRQNSTPSSRHGSHSSPAHAPFSPSGRPLSAFEGLRSHGGTDSPFGAPSRGGAIPQPSFPSNRPSNGGGGRLHILLVGRDVALQQVLQTEGFVCTMVAKTSDTLATVQQHDNFDCVLFDKARVYNMSTTARCLRVWEASRSAEPRFTPVICTTVSPPAEVSFDGWVSGVNAIAYVPFEQVSLARDLKQYLESHAPSAPPSPSKGARHECVTQRLGCLHVYLEPLLRPDIALHKCPVVLIVDDEPANTMLLTKILQRYPVFQKIIALKDGSEVLPLLIERNFKVDLILIDELMKTMMGSVATAQVRAYEEEHSLRRIPIISVTANKQSFGLDHFADAGTDGVMMKPIDPSSVHSSISSFLSVMRSRASNRLSVGSCSTGSLQVGYITIFPAKRGRGGSPQARNRRKMQEQEP